ncbi:hypothetical protein [uncultured Shewanella sp.]|uniref:helix-turn-helix domain-containing protein n=1 Tax=uncultured Shewanella sp. TaxID=173975 RepID=UPI0026107D62|nr:hypothetical protein [uncultured Shewanella sp.]
MTELDDIRTSFDLTETQLAEVMQVSEAEVQQWQAGVSEPRVSSMFKLMDFMRKRYLNHDWTEDNFMLGRDDQPAFNPDSEDNAAMPESMPELDQEENEKVRTKLNQVSSVTNMLLLATDERELHYGSLSFMSDALLEMKQILKT